MSLVLQSSGGGSVTIAEPTTASNFTQTLPAADGTVVVTGTTPTLNGITFPATQVPSADANTLDDYEEGTWTPTALGGTSAGTTTYVGSPLGFYTKVGNLVNASAYIGISAMTGTGNMHLSLPFASNQNMNHVGSAGTYDLNWPSAGSIVSYSVASHPYARIHVSVDNGPDAIVQTENGSWELYYSVAYRID
jgi:hypothetical protein